MPTKAQLKRKQIEDLARVRETKNAEIRRLILEENRVDVLAALLDYDVAPFHVLLLRHKLGVDCGNRVRAFTLTIGPRGFGKSSIRNVVYNIWRILKNPNIRILIGSKASKKAKSFLSEIKGKLQNERLVEIFGDQVGPKWEEESIIVRGRTIVAKEPTVSITGWDSQVASGHYDAIVCDDLVDENNAQTEHLRGQMFKFFYKTLLPTLEPDGEFDVLGTRYHHDDLYNHLSRYDTDFARATLIVDCFDKNGESIWPEKFSTEKLREMETNMGSIIFDSQYRGRTDKMIGKIFNFDMFRWIDKAPSPTGMKVWQGIDLAISSSDVSASFAYVTVFHDKENHKYYVVDVFEGTLSFLEQTEFIIDRFHKFDPIRTGIEANGYQAAKLQELRQSKDERARAVRAHPVYTSKDKTARAWKLTADFERGDIIFVRGVCTALMNRLLEMAPGKKKGTDLFDALDIALTVSKRGVKRKRRKEPGLL